MNNLFDQYLPTYKEDFKNDPRWIIKESAHYIFHYFLDSVTYLGIDEVEKIQEESFNNIISLLKVNEPKVKIKYYFYPSREIKKDLMGDDIYAQAIYKDFSIHVLYTDKIKPIGEHEDTHLLSLPLGQATGFFAEGLAEYLSLERLLIGRKKIDWFKDSKDKIISIENMVSHSDWINNTPDDDNLAYYYSFVGFFVKKMIEDFGIDNFKDFYGEIKRNMNFEEIDSIFKKHFGINLVSFSQLLGLLR